VPMIVVFPSVPLFVPLSALARISLLALRETRQCHSCSMNLDAQEEQRGTV
jgi:hypothetical protein